MTSTVLYSQQEMKFFIIDVQGARPVVQLVTSGRVSGRHGFESLQTLYVFISFIPPLWKARESENAKSKESATCASAEPNAT